MDAKPLPVRVVVTGDHTLMRTAIARLIAAEPDMDVVGDCSNRADVLAEAVAAAPDVVVMDIDREAGRPEAVAQLLMHVRQCAVLVLTGCDDPQTHSAMLGHGALGVVFKNRPVETLMSGIRAVVAGQSWLEPSMLPLMFGRQQQRTDAPGKLTRREREIVDLVSLGLKNRKIGERLFISETTVRHHLTSIFTKLAVTSRLELMRYTYGGSDHGSIDGDA